MDTKPQAQSFQKTALIPLYGWLILAALCVWNVWAFLPRQQAWAEITYSDLLEQVNAGNVSQVTFIGNEISGTLIHPATRQADMTPASYTKFHTIMPLSGGDSGLVSLLTWRHVRIDAKPISMLWLPFLWKNGIPVFLLILMLGFLIFKATRRFPAMKNHGLNPTQKFTVQRPSQNFADVGGEEEAKNYLRNIMDSLHDPEAIQNMVRQAPLGVLLVGQPGTGKTLLVHALAGEFKLPLLTIHGSNWYQMDNNDLRDFVNQASKEPLSIIHFDHLDAANQTKWEGETTLGSHNIPISQLFAEFEASEKSQQVLIIGETSRPERLDPELLGPSRFDREVSLRLPERAGREEILKLHTKNLHLAKNVNLGVIARTTTGLSGAELARLCHQAALQSAKKGSDQVTMADFEEALDHLLLGVPRKLTFNEEERRIVAYHQAGHVLAAWIIPGSDPIRKVSILQDQHISGIGDRLPQENRYYSKSSLLAHLAVLLAGRAAEEVIFGEVTTGAEYDLIEATRLARRMITRWGMGQSGPIAFDTHDNQALMAENNHQTREYSESTAERIDQELQELLAAAYTDICKLLMRNKKQLDDLVEALIRDEMIHQEAIMQILGSRPPEAAAESHAAVTISDLEHSQYRS